MLGNIKQAIVNKIAELYSPPIYTIYDEDIPQNFKKDSFLITLVDQDYDKRMNVKFDSLLSFDIAYFSNSADLKEDCQEVQLKLFREMDLMGSYRVLNKQATTIDNVLHITFNVKYSEIMIADEVKMLNKETKLKGKGD